jgi:hypothetical protein
MQRWRFSVLMQWEWVATLALSVSTACNDDDLARHLQTAAQKGSDASANPESGTGREGVAAGGSTGNRGTGGTASGGSAMTGGSAMGGGSVVTGGSAMDGGGIGTGGGGPDAAADTGMADVPKPAKDAGSWSGWDGTVGDGAVRSCKEGGSIAPRGVLKVRDDTAHCECDGAWIACSMNLADFCFEGLSCPMMPLDAFLRDVLPRRTGYAGGTSKECGNFLEITFETPIDPVAMSQRIMLRFAKDTGALVSAEADQQCVPVHEQHRDCSIGNVWGRASLGGIENAFADCTGGDWKYCSLGTFGTGPACDP